MMLDSWMQFKQNTFTLSMGYMKQCSKIPEAAPATICVPTVLDAGKFS